MNGLFSNTLNKMFKNREDAASMDLEKIREIKEANEVGRRKELASRNEMAARELQQSEEHFAHQKRIGVACAELARDLGATSARFLEHALAMRQPTAVHLMAPYLMITGLTSSPDVRGPKGQNIEAAIEARWVLAGTVLPPVRRDDAVFGGAEKRLRDLPPIRPMGDAVSEVNTWYVRWALEAGVSIPDAPKALDSREVEIEIARIRRDEKANAYDRVDYTRNAALAEREIALVITQSQQDTAKARAEFPRLRDRQRKTLVDVIDRVVASLDIGIAWWWAREFRRAVAGEPLRLPEEQLTAWRFSQALGVRFPFETLTKD